MTLAAVRDLEPPAALLPPLPSFSPAKRRVFEAALTLFAERGYHAVSVRDIAGLLGLQPMALYTHAKSKQELLFEIVQIGFETHRGMLIAALLEAGTDPIDQIRALCAAHVRAHLTYRALARVTTRETEQLEPRFDEQLHLLRIEAVRSFREVVARGQRLGVFGDENPVLLIHAIAGMGIRASQWWTPESGIEVDEVARTFAEFSIRILTGNQPR